MTPKRKLSKAVEREGVNYVRSIVEGCNCTFTEVALGNDIGNDAYVEVISEEEATGCCVGAQIKSGSSYVSSDQKTYYLRADRSHFEYWAAHILPIAGIVFNPVTNRAVWCDITEYLENKPTVIQDGPYQVAISAAREFSRGTFQDFARHFLKYQEKYKGGENFGRSLELFADVDNVRRCFEGIKSLFFHHRNRTATWHFFAISLPKLKDKFLRSQLALCLAHIPGHPDILWHEGNIIDSDVREQALSLIKRLFGRDEVQALLELVDEYGFERGCIGESVHAIIDVVPNRDSILESVAFDKRVEGKTRCDSLMLLVYYTQESSADAAMQLISSYLERFPDSEYKGALAEIRQAIEEFGNVAFY